MASNLAWTAPTAIRGFPPYHPVDIQQGPGLGFHPSTSRLEFDIFVPQHLQERFHADFFALSKVGDTDEMNCAITNRPGYDRITYTVTRRDASEIANARDIVLKHVVEQLSGFYYVVQVTNRLNGRME